MGADDVGTVSTLTEIGFNRFRALFGRELRKGVAGRFGHGAAESADCLVGNLRIDIDNIHFDRTFFKAFVGQLDFFLLLDDFFIFPEGGMQIHFHRG